MEFDQVGGQGGDGEMPTLVHRVVAWITMEREIPDASWGVPNDTRSRESDLLQEQALQRAC